MPENEIRKRVRERLANGTLPHHLPATDDAPLTPGKPSPALGDPRSRQGVCAVCDEEGTQLRFKVPSSVLTFHHLCFKLWEEERNKGGKPAG